MNKLVIEFPSSEDCAFAYKEIQEQINKGNGNQLYGINASILLCSLSRANKIYSSGMTEKQAKKIRLGY